MPYGNIILVLKVSNDAYKDFYRVAYLISESNFLIIVKRKGFFIMSIVRVNYNTKCFLSNVVSKIKGTPFYYTIYSYKKQACKKLDRFYSQMKQANLQYLKLCSSCISWVCKLHLN